MFVKNTGPKVIGFGDVILIPGDSGELPDGFDQQHPTVQFYIGKGWITPTLPGAALSTPQEPPHTEPTEEEKARAEEERLAAEEQSKKDAEAQKIKGLARMSLSQLQDEAKSLGIEFAETDTKAILTQKITDVYQVE
jgi:hypothetical protein